MRITRSKAIRLKCLDCCCNQAKEVRLCPSQDCPLWHYRLGYEVDAEGKRIGKKKGIKNAQMCVKNEVENDACEDQSR